MPKPGGGGGSVDQQGLINAQAQANRIAQFTPQGTLQFGQVGSGGEFVPGGGAAAQLTESPFQSTFRRGFEDLATIGQQSAAPRIQNLPLAPIDITRFPERRFNLDFSNVDPVPSSADFSDDARRVEGATFQRGLGLLQPEFDLQDRRLETKLVNQGIPLGAQAFDRDFKTLGQRQGNALSSLALDAVQAGRGEQSRLFGQGLASRGAQLGDQIQDINLQNQQRATAINEQQSLRSNELSELASILGLQTAQPVGLQSFFAPANIDVTGPAQLAQQASQANANRSQANTSSAIQGASSIALAALLFSSRKLKGGGKPVDEESILERIKELPVEFWHFLENPSREHIGTYAEDFKEKFGVGDGKTISIIDAFGVVMAAIKALARKQELAHAS